MKSLLPVDELNVLKEYLRAAQNAAQGLSAKEVEDEVEDLLILAYVYGYRQVSEMLNTPLQADTDKMRESLYKKIAEKTFAERIAEYAPDGDIEAILKVADTEMHRIYNEAELEAAREAGASEKTWVTMLDSKVREAHEVLEGVTVGLEEKFYTSDGDGAIAPGGFENAENNVNCRCELIFK